MAVLVDTPRWPAHGTLWAHLVSDTSLAELHAFAARCGVPRRSFDLDHYDVPAARHAELVAAGAQHVEGRELVRRLRASGLRVRATERPARTELARRWAELLPAHPAVGEELAVRWSEPHRVYHGVEHLLAVLDRLRLLADGGERVSRAVVLAAWCHDAVHDGTTPADEEASAALAARLLGPVVGADDAVEVARLVRVTADHVPSPDDAPGRVLCDADLGVLGGAPEDYRRYAEQVRAEYRHVPEPDFRRGRAAVLSSLLDRPRLYVTPTGARLWEEAARRNVGAELARLRAG
ncbi:Predicted metal-dependent phosphohydrolase, HD superfamily [Georgenia satyanarayanai]|uniref:Predicted metal-dependent phosphohydrolase, HD superfamily n=1 Tax=Georgenia satyanarayanai TaxID=860221 RepID=A0A2Y9C4A5_9MICO|nr:DUF4031 domain-containing protein [Georgenia satyanarayanai]PYG01034.1 putative metal-dependent HD superfamily phosphohydrolase [Georgenia satyanarayanai]SSA39273.1 Predicted metal-dependent phosphohydrolase, HD superfamily [Georgenia satyanarayanai]